MGKKETRTNNKLIQEWKKLAVHWDFSKESLTYWNRRIRSVLDRSIAGDLSRAVVLDEGCSQGLWLDYWKKRDADFVIGIDIVPEMAQLAKKYNQNVDIVIADIRKMPFKDYAFDIISSLGVIEHFHESDVAVKEASRILKKNGLFLVSIPNPANFMFKLYVQLASIRTSVPWQKYITLKEVFNILQNSEFHILKISGYHMFPFLEVLRLYDCPILKSRFYAPLKEFLTKLEDKFYFVKCARAMYSMIFFECVKNHRKSERCMLTLHWKDVITKEIRKNSLDIEV